MQQQAVDVVKVLRSKEYLEVTHGKRPDGYKETIVYSTSSRVRCSGENNDHPLVYYTIPDGGEVVCGYCDIKFKRKPE